MWKVFAEPTTSAGVGLWNSNSHEERPTPNPAAVAYSLFLIPLFHSFIIYACLASSRAEGDRMVGKWLNLGRQSESLGLEEIKSVGHTGFNLNQ